MPRACRIVGITSGVLKVALVLLGAVIEADQNTMGTRWTGSLAPPWSPYAP